MEGPAVVVEVETAHTLHGLMLVSVSFSDLRIRDGCLVGDYELNVPFRKRENESGRVEIRLAKPIEDYLSKGGTARGLAVPADDAPVRRPIMCTIEPHARRPGSGLVQFAVDDGDRVLRFRSRYSVGVEDSGVAVAGD